MVKKQNLDSLYMRINRSPYPGVKFNEQQARGHRWDKRFLRVEEMAFRISQLIVQFGLARFDPELLKPSYWVAIIDRCYVALRDDQNAEYVEAGVFKFTREIGNNFDGAITVTCDIGSILDNRINLGYLEA